MENIWEELKSNLKEYFGFVLVVSWGYCAYALKIAWGIVDGWYPIIWFFFIGLPQNFCLLFIWGFLASRLMNISINISLPPLLHKVIGVLLIPIYLSFLLFLGWNTYLNLDSLYAFYFFITK